ncbi:MarR family winged helix-turn-helix transcriptional regulator [Lysobacter terrae]
MAKNTDTDRIIEGAAKNRALLRDLGTELNILMSTARAFAVHAAASFQPELSSSAFQILQWLHARGPTRASQLAEGLAMDRSVISRLIKQLRQLELVAVSPDDGDRRGVTVSISSSAQSKVAAAMTSKGELFEARFRGWSEGDVRKLTELLHQVNSKIT